MKILFILLLLTSNLYATTDSIKIHYASIYADRLIEKFDSELETLLGDPLKSETYLKLISSRIYIENLTHDIPAYEVYSKLFVAEPNEYQKIIDEIDANAKELTALVAHEKERANLVIYPSTGSAGNISGNSFPNKVWSLTFDDGPRSSRTDSIVDSLVAFNMRGTFFMLTREAKKYTRSRDYVLENDMELALHSYNHKNLPKQSAATVDYEVRVAKTELEEMTDRSIKFFRLPYGAGLRNSLLRSVIKDENMVHVFWNVDTLDWKDKDPRSIFNRTVKQMKRSRNDAGVILFHDIHKQTVIASRMVMEYLYRNTYKVCTLDEIVSFLNLETETVCN